MSRKDFLEEMFSELPSEKAPEGFTRKVMHEVMTDWSLNPTIYKPVISKKGWWGIGLVAVAFILFLFFIQSTIGEPTESPINLKFLSDLDVRSILAPVSRNLARLTTISPAIGIGALAIIALWFFDQLFTRLARS